MPHSRHTRREFCVQACQLASLAGFGTLLGACGGGSSDIGSALPVINATRTNNITTLTIESNSALATVGGMALVQSPGASFLVARTSQEACTALTSVCTHEACTVSNASGNVYTCPCHGSQFDPSGNVVRGPAATALQQFPSQLANGVLTISG